MKHRRFIYLWSFIALVALLAACSSSPMPVAEETLEPEATTTAYILAYSKYDGHATYYTFDLTGAYTPVANLSFSSGWTQIVKVPYGLFFYNANTGAAAFGRLNTRGVYTQLVTYPAGSFWTGWTHIINMPSGVFFYRASDGVAYLGTFDQNGNFITINWNPGAFSAGWSHIVNTPNGLFFYRASDGASAFGRFDVNGVYNQLNSGTFMAGWTQIVNTWRGVLFYRAMDNVLPTRSALAKFDVNGVYTETNSNLQAGPPEASKIITFSTRDIFFYAPYGSSEVGYLRSNNTYSFKFANNSFLDGWSSIVSVR